MALVQADPGHQKAMSPVRELWIGEGGGCSAEEAFLRVLWPGLLARADLAEAMMGSNPALATDRLWSPVLVCLYLEMMPGGAYLSPSGVKSDDPRARAVLTGKGSEPCHFS